MGKRIKSIDEPINQEPITESNERKSKRDTDSKTTKNRKSERGTTEKEIVPRLVNVEIPDPDPSVPIPKVKKDSKKKNVKKPIVLESQQVAVLIKSTFDILGSKQGYEIWKLDQAEVDQIAEPLTNVLKRVEVLEKTFSQYADICALLIAIGSIIIPRLLIQRDQKEKQKKEINSNDRKTDPRNEGNKIGTIGASNRQPTRSTTVTRENIGEQLFDTIPSIV